jgi:hypothetical protein
MIKTFLGTDGHYDIDDNGNVIQRMIDRFGKFTGEIKKYRNARNIPNLLDREGVINLLQMLKIYKFTGRC